MARGVRKSVDDQLNEISQKIDSLEADIKKKQATIKELKKQQAKLKKDKEQETYQQIEEIAKEKNVPVQELLDKVLQDLK